MREYRYWITAAPRMNLRNAAWLDTRAKLSDLLEDEDQFNDFAKHCGNLLVSDEARLDDRRSESERQQMVSRWLHQLLTLTKPELFMRLLLAIAQGCSIGVARGAQRPGEVAPW